LAADSITLKLDPNNLATIINAATYSYALGRVDDAFTLGESLLRMGKPERALEVFRAETDDEWRVKGTALALYELGRTQEFEQKFKELREGWGDRWPIEIAHVYAWIGDFEPVFPLLERDFEINGPGGVMVDPFFTSLHDDPRWQTLLKEAGVSKEQLESIEFVVNLPN